MRQNKKNWKGAITFALVFVLLFGISAAAAPTNQTIYLITNSSTSGHWFTVNASADDADGFADIDFVEINISAGSCAWVSNDTNDANTLRIQFNCTHTSPTPVTFNVTFNDTLDAQVITANSANTYPDPNSAVLLAPSITPNIAYTTSTLTCNSGAGNWSDADGDTEATKTYRWFNGTSLIAGETSATLAPSNFAASDLIICEVFATNTTWYTSNDTTNSSARIISALGLGNATIDLYTNATTSHQFNVTASVDNPEGAADTNYTNITVTAGTCTYLSNSTSGNTLTVVYNCSATSEAAPNITVGFKNSSGSQLNTSTGTNAYPDTAPTLTAPSVTPASPTTTSTLTCNVGTFSDADLDTENTSAITYRWFKNSALISGQTAATLAPSNFAGTNTIYCEQTTVATNWPTNTVATNSSAVTITAPPVSSHTVSSGGGSFPPRPSGLITCTESWSCTDWSTCLNGTSTRKCVDMNSCKAANNKPEISKSCGTTKAPEQEIPVIKPPVEEPKTPTQTVEEKATVNEAAADNVTGTEQTTITNKEEEDIFSTLGTIVLIILVIGVIGAGAFVLLGANRGRRKSL